MKALSQAAIIGGGVIGGGWAARLLLAGVDVAVADPSPDAERKMAAVLANAERAMARLWPHAGLKKGKLSFTASIGDAVVGADLIQESAPERLDVKKRVHEEIGEAAGADAVIGSSTSGLLPSEIQAGTLRADRMLVAHPYNPVYLLPVVEIVGGKDTSADTITRAMEIYSSIGMKPVQIDKEIDAFVGDRLLEAMWRESLWLIKEGVASAETIDDVVRYGLGLRYAQMGQFMTYRLAGGEAGMRHFLEQFGPSLKWPWTKLMDVPPWDDALIETITRQSDEQAGGQSIRDLEAIRDDNLVDILKVLHKNNWGAGALLEEPPANKVSGFSADGMLITWRGIAAREWADYNDHMTEARYLDVFSHANDGALIPIGGGPDYVKSGASWYTLETHIRHLDEVVVGGELLVETQFVEHDNKRLHLMHYLYEGDDKRLLATGEHMLIHVDMTTRRSSAMPDEMQQKCEEITKRQSGLSKPDFVGAAIGIRRK